VGEWTEIFEKWRKGLPKPLFIFAVKEKE